MSPRVGEWDGVIVEACQLVTQSVSLCEGQDYLWQVEGRYFLSSVLGAQVHMMLPAEVMGDRARYLPAPLMCVLALAP